MEAACCHYLCRQLASCLALSTSNGLQSGGRRRQALSCALKDGWACLAREPCTEGRAEDRPWYWGKVPEGLGVGSQGQGPELEFAVLHLLGLTICFSFVV